MRLICPNCAAQYEVPEDVIPVDGRDVQCSACGDTWFQLHPSHPDYKPAFDPEASEDDFDESEEIEAATDENVEEAYDPEPDDEPFEDDAHEEPPTQPMRQELSEDVASVLREEAERETQAREAEMGGGLETQPDLGLQEGDDAEHRTRQAQERMARLRGLDDQIDPPVSDLVQSPNPDAPVPETDIDLGTRANLLPEVEDVDQRIEAQSDGAAEASAARDGSRVATQKEGRSGFARGMRLSILMFVLAAALYIFAPQLSAMVPALQEPLVGYTGLIDQGRAALQGVVGQFAN